MGKQLDESRKSRRINDVYFSRLKELSSNPQLAPRFRFMIKDVLDQRTNNWVPRGEEVNAKTIMEIHTEAEKDLGLRPGATAVIRGNGGAIPAVGPTSPGGFLINQPGTGLMMPGMVGTRRMLGMPGFDNDSWEVTRSRSMSRGDGSATQAAAGRMQYSPYYAKSLPMNSWVLPQGRGGLIGVKSSAFLQGSGGPPACSFNFAEPPTRSPGASKAMPAPLSPPAAEKLVASCRKLNPEELKRKTVSLLKEYFSIRLLDEALQCVEELSTPSFHPDVVKEAVFLALEANPPSAEAASKLLAYLLEKKVLVPRDLEIGCTLYASLLDNTVYDLPKAPNNFGEIIGNLVLSGGLNFKVVMEILKKVEDGRNQKAVFDAAMMIIRSNSVGQAVVDSQASDIEACESLFT